MLFYAVLDERRDPDAPPLDRQTARRNLTLRMALLLDDLRNHCARHLRPLYKANPALVSSIQLALDLLFPDRRWIVAPPDAESPKWWSKTRDILDSLVA